MKIKLFQPNNQPVKPVSVPPTRFDCVLDLVVLFLCILSWALAIGLYLDAPEQIPTGFDAMGNPRSWGSPVFYFFFAVMATFVTTLMFVSLRYPQLINLPVTLNEQTIIPQSALMARCIRWINIICSLIFLLILTQVGGYQYEPMKLNTTNFILGIFLLIFVMIGIIIFFTARISRVKTK
ncbi:MAG: DUF1648 domain-containing protein [Bacteroidaceae bacterium]|nr:DUF1648 domain-containing protein [Bacteroidaceae bacterium]